MGFKVLGRAGTSKMLFDFEIYQGGDGTRSPLGQGGDVVMKLVFTLAKISNYKIYADNLFTSVLLLEKLLGWGLKYTGAVRQNQLPNCNINGEKELKKEGRGSFDFRVKDTYNILAVRWFDNQAVTLLLTHTCVEPLRMAGRWDKKAKKRIDVFMPAIVADYNNHIGGIDILDPFLLPDKQILPQRKFQAIVAECLVSVDSDKKRGRRASSNPLITKQKVVNIPCADVKKDQVVHWPAKSKKRGRLTLLPHDLYFAAQQSYWLNLFTYSIEIPSLDVFLSAVTCNLAFSTPGVYFIFTKYFEYVKTKLFMDVKKLFRKICCYNTATKSSQSLEKPKLEHSGSSKQVPSKYRT
ncbi:piggyBac transposable element-derived protein 1-like [Watersipora subatra]|uniref:piggyBac transposable element-derived protein 1-like n=1 Tax=Watersipora subatra TaxID=2589382 RepID=UPI00355BA57B